MKLTHIERILKNSDEFVEEMGKDALFAETPPETAQEALAEIGQILDAVADENGIDEETELDDEDEDELLDAAEEASAQDDEEFEEIHQSFLRNGLEGVDGKNLTIIEVGGPHAQINVNPAAVADEGEELTVEPVGEEEVIDIGGEENEAPLMLDEEAPVDIEEEDEEFIGASFKAVKNGKSLFSSVRSGTTLKALSQGLHKPVVAHKVTIQAGFRDRTPQHRKAWAAAVMLFSSRFRGYPETARDFAYVQLQAARLLSKTEGYQVPSLDLSQSKQGQVIRSLVFSKLREEIKSLRGLFSAYGDKSDEEFESEYASMRDTVGKIPRGSEDPEHKKAIDKFKGMQKMKSYREKGSSPDLNPAAGRAKANSPWALSPLLAKYQQNNMTQKEAVILFSALVKNGYVPQMDDQMKEDVGFLIESGLIDRKGVILKSGFIKSEDASSYDFFDGGDLDPKNRAKLPNGLPKLAGLPSLPQLLASSKKFLVSRSGPANIDTMGSFENTQGGSTEEQNLQTIDDGFDPGSTRLNKNSERVDWTSDQVSNEAPTPPHRRQSPRSMIAPKEEGDLGDGAKKYGADRDLDLNQDTQVSTFGPVDPDSVTGVDHIEIVPLKIEASIRYRLTPFNKVNQNYSIATRNFEIVLSRKDAAALGFPIDADRKLFSAQEIPQLRMLLSRAKETESFVKCDKERTVLRPDLQKALILKNSNFSTILVKAGLVNGTKNSAFSTFRRIGDQYISPEGHVFSSTSALKYGRPEFLVISQSQKSFFGTKTQVSASVTFSDILSKVDHEILASSRNDADLLAQQNASLQRKLVAMNSAYEALKKEASKNAAIMSRKVSQLENLNQGLKTDLNTLKLTSRSAERPKLPGAVVQSSNEPHPGKSFRTGAAKILGQG